MGKSRASKKRAKDDDAEVAMAKAVQRLQEIFSEHSEQEIRATLLECNMNQNLAIHRLLPQQDASNEQGASTQLTDSSTTTTTSSVLVPNQSDLPNVPVSSGEAVPLSSEPSSSAITNGESRNVPISSNEAVPSMSMPSSSDVTNGETRSVPISSTEAVPSLSVPSSSDVTNGETRSVPISSTAAVPSFSVPSPSDVTNGETRSVPISSTAAVPSFSVPSPPSDITNGETRSMPASSNVAVLSFPAPSSRAPTNAKTKRQAYRMISASDPSWANVLRGLHKKPDATNRSSNSLTEESDAARREPNPQHSAFPVNQPVDTRQQSTAAASLLGPRPPTSMSTDVNSFFSSEKFQQHGGSNSYTLAHDDTSNEQGASTQLTDSSITTSSSVLIPNQSDLPNVPVSSGEAVPLSSEPSSSAITNGESRGVPISSNDEVPSSSMPSSSDVTNGESRSVPVSSNVAVPSLSVPSSSDVKNGETRTVPISSTEEVPSSSSVPSSSDVTNGETRSVTISSNVAAPSLSVPSSSDITNGETRSVTISSSAAAPSLSVPSSRAPTNDKTKRQVSRMISASDPSWADVFWGLHKKPDATNRSSNSLSQESDAARREPNPRHSAFPVNQSMDTRQQSTVTASLLGPRRPTSMADLDSFFSSAGFQKRSGSNSYTLAYDANMTNPHYTWIEPDDTSIYQSLDSAFAPYRNRTLPLSASSSVPSSHGSDYGFGNAENSRLGYEDVLRNNLHSNLSGASSSVPSCHGSDYGFDMTSGNAANSRLWSGSIPGVHHLPSDSSGGAFSIGPSWHVNGSNSRLGYGDYLPPVHHQGSRSSNEWTVQSEESYCIPSHWRLPGYIPSQQELEAYRSFGYERLRAYNASLNQENNTEWFNLS